MTHTTTYASADRGDPDCADSADRAGPDHADGAGRAVGQACLVLMAKAPARGKRRLAAIIGASRATAVAGHLAACALEDVDAWPGPACLAPASAADREWLERRVARDDALTVLQGEGNLGERINHVSRTLRALGVARQIYIGTDCPQLDADYLRRADAELRHHDVVLGPAVDGGVVLMASARPWPDLAPLPWSTAGLHQGLEALCTELDLTVSTLEARADVDAPADLEVLRRTLRHDRRPARRALLAWLDAEAR